MNEKTKIDRSPKKDSKKSSVIPSIQNTNRPHSNESLGKGRQAAFLTEAPKEADVMNATPFSGEAESDHEGSEDDGTLN